MISGVKIKDAHAIRVRQQGAIVTLNYFVTAFANHSQAATAAGLDQQANSFAEMVAQLKEQIEQFKELGERSIFTKFN